MFRIISRQLLVLILTLPTSAWAESEQISETVCRMAELMDGDSKTLIEKYEYAVTANSKIKLSMITGSALEHLLIGYALLGHDKVTHVRNTATKLLKWCDTESAPTSATCDQYRLAAKEPALFIDSLAPNRAWISQAQYIANRHRAELALKNAKSLKSRGDALLEQARLKQACIKHEPIEKPEVKASAPSFDPEDPYLIPTGARAYN